MQESKVSGIKLFGMNIRLRSDEDEISHGETKPSSPAKRTEKILNCPRCTSRETKFCYFNNYNTKQPRHFCKSCHRYWTAGGSMRNVPVGAGRRKSTKLPSVSVADHSPEHVGSPLESKRARVLVPKTLRIDEPAEAVMSSLWAALGIDGGSGMLAGLRRSGNCVTERGGGADARTVLMANPAALSRSINFNEASL